MISCPFDQSSLTPNLTCLKCYYYFYNKNNEIMHSNMQIVLNNYFFFVYKKLDKKLVVKFNSYSTPIEPKKLILSCSSVNEFIKIFQSNRIKNLMTFL